VQYEETNYPAPIYIPLRGFYIGNNLTYVNSSSSASVGVSNITIGQFN